MFGAWKPVVRSTTLPPGRSDKIVVDMVGAGGRSVRLDQLHEAHRLSVTIAVPGSSKSVELKPSQVGDHYELTYLIPRSFAGRAVTVSAVFHVSVGGADVATAPSSQTLKVLSTTAAAGQNAGPDRSTPAGVPVAQSTPVRQSGPPFLLIAVALVVLGLLVGLLMMIRSHRRKGTFVDPSRLMSARVAIRVRRDATLTRLNDDGGESALVLRASDFTACSVRRGRVRSFALNDLNFKVVPSRGLFRRGYGEVSRQGRYVTASAGAMLGRRFTVGRVPLDLSGTWVYELDGDNPGGESPFVDGFITVFVKGSAPAARQANRLVESFNSFLSDVVLRLASPTPAKARTAEPSGSTPVANESDRDVAASS